MKPIVVDPDNYDKHFSWCQARGWCTHFLKENNILTPRMLDDQYCPYYGQYINAYTLVVNVDKCKVPVKSPVRSYTYTGYKSDLTVAGVLAHECGHTVWRHHRMPRGYKKQWASTIKGRPRVSGYEPNNEEAFAESMKLFILNPDLLKVGRRERYDFIISCDLTPTCDLAWREVLTHAHPRLISAAESWIGQAR